ncbi:hypothetical protein [Verrucomicrobium spinosum]|nr:hypothetical protein [Verrucomicrobium spinosum]
MKSLLQAAAVGLAMATTMGATTAKAAEPEPVYEMRIYTTNEASCPTC